MKTLNNDKIKIFDRSKSIYKIVIFMEYIPHVLGKYVEENPKFIKSCYGQANNIINF